MSTGFRSGLSNLKSKHDAESPVKQAAAEIADFSAHVEALCAQVRAESANREHHEQLRARLQEAKTNGQKLASKVEALRAENEKNRRLQEEFPQAKQDSLSRLQVIQQTIESSLQLVS